MNSELYSAQTRCSNLHYYDVKYFPTHIYIAHHFPDGISEGYSGKVPVNDGVIGWDIGVIMNSYVFACFKFPLEIREYFDKIAETVYKNKAFW